MSKTVRKTGLFGGTFDPVHTGHLFLAEAARDKFGLDEVLFWPNPAPYHRAGSEVTPLEDRIVMTKLAVSDNPAFRFSDFEISLPGDSYTAKTLELFHEKYPELELYFILGGDSLFSIEYWKYPEKIFSLATILSCKRQGQQRGATGILHPSSASCGAAPKHAAEDAGASLDDKIDSKIRELKERYGARIFNLHVPEIEISSSDIKARVRDGRSIKYCTPDKVAEYIYEKRLYVN